MLAFRVDLLTGRYVATVYNDRSAAEWPPQPARFFSALVATWGESEARSTEEREALLWLEQQPAPFVAASDASARELCRVFVPVNDTTVHGDLEELYDAARSAQAAVQDAAPRGRAKAERAAAKAQARLVQAMSPSAKESPRTALAAAVALLPERRPRRERGFPSVTPEQPVVYFVWRDSDAPPHIVAGLASLARRLSRLGHSSSLVSCRLVAEAPSDGWAPDEDGREVLRVPSRGQLDILDLALDHKRATEPRTLEYSHQRYRRLASTPTCPPTPCSLFSDAWIVLRRVEGPRLPSTRAVDVAESLRAALLCHAEQPVRPVLSGHGPGGEPTDGPHLAVLALPFVGSKFADGSVLGAALVLPRDLPEADRRHVQLALGRWEGARRLDDEETPRLPVQLGAVGVLEVERVLVGAQVLSALRPETWCGPASTWCSATPIALDRNPGRLRSRHADPAERAAIEARAAAEARETIALACERIGLPRPVEVVVLPSVTLPGTAKAMQFPPFPRDRARTQRVKVHARLRFADPVRGPIILGAGRYLGLGLMRPVREEELGG